MKTTAFLLFMNTAYFDTWFVILDRIKRFGPKNMKFFAMVDDNYIQNNNSVIHSTDFIKQLFEFDDIFLYDKTDRADSERLLKVCPMIQQKYNNISYILLTYDSHVLLDKVDDDQLDLLEKIMIENNIDQIRLSRSGLKYKDDFPEFPEIPNLHKIKKIEYYQYSANYPAIFNIANFLEIHKNFKNVPHVHIETGPVQNQFRLLKNYYIYHDSCCHGSSFGPYPNYKLISRSAWLYTDCLECQNNSENIFKEYNIDKSSKKMIA